jgi:hypothetical protein
MVNRFTQAFVLFKTNYMRKQLFAMAAAVVLFAACHNGGSSTVGEKDEEYSKSFERQSTDAHNEKHASPSDNTQTGEHVDTTHAAQSVDTTHH